jgi:hypothetical protein
MKRFVKFEEPLNSINNLLTESGLVHFRDGFSEIDGKHLIVAPDGTVIGRFDAGEAIKLCAEHPLAEIEARVL